MACFWEICLKAFPGCEELLAEVCHTFHSRTQMQLRLLSLGVWTFWNNIVVSSPYGENRDVRLLAQVRTAPRH